MENVLEIDTVISEFTDLFEDLRGRPINHEVFTIIESRSMQLAFELGYSDWDLTWKGRVMTAKLWSDNKPTVAFEIELKG